MTGHTTELENWIAVLKAEYREMPGLQLTKPQARRLWGLDASACDALLDSLWDAGFLRVTPRGCYALAETGGERSRSCTGTYQLVERKASACD